MSVTINSATTNYYDYSVSYNLYTRQVTIAEASSFKTGGAALVGDETYTITSPSGIVQTGTIDPSSPTPLAKNMAFLGTSVEFGTYTIVGVFTDADDTEYTLTKTTNICKPVQCTPALGANGCVDLSWTVRCIDNLIIVADQTSFTLTINGVATLGTPTYGITILNPNGVTLADDVASPYFQLSPVVNGAYWVSVDDVAVYSAGDLVTVTVHYILQKTQKLAQCNINLCEFECALQDLQTSIDANAGTGNILERTLIAKRNEISYLLCIAQIQIDCGGDTSATLVRLTALTGITCSCNCGTTNLNQGVSLTPGSNVIVQALNKPTVTSETIGLTTTYTVGSITVSVNALNSTWLTVTTTTTSGATTYSILADTEVLAHKMGGIIYDNCTGVYTANSTTETTLMTYTMPADTMNTNGDIIKWTAMIQNQLASGANNRTIRFKFGGTTIYTLTITLATLDAFQVLIEMHRTAVNTQYYTVSYNQCVPFSTGTANIVTFTTAAFDLSASKTIAITGQLASGAANAVVLANMTVELLRKAT